MLFITLSMLKRFQRLKVHVTLPDIAEAVYTTVRSLVAAIYIKQFIQHQTGESHSSCTLITHSLPYCLLYFACHAWGTPWLLL